MAASCLWASGVVNNSNFRSVRLKLGGLHGLRTQPSVGFEGFVFSDVLKKQTFRRWIWAADEAHLSNVEDDSEETKSANNEVSTIAIHEVESLLTALCDTTSIAEFQLKHKGFLLKVSRNLANCCNSTSTSTSSPTPASNDHSVSSTASVLEMAARQGILIIKSPTVGEFWKSRNVKGVRLPPACKEKDIIMEGEPLCFVEQLCSQIPIEAKITGKVIKILKKDGDLVAFDDPLIAILPCFPGI